MAMDEVNPIAVDLSYDTGIIMTTIEKKLGYPVTSYILHRLIGKVLLRVLSSQRIFFWVKNCSAVLFYQFQLIRLRIERLRAKIIGRRSRLRIITTACWDFPIYSQTFVYQELTQLIRRSFEVRFLYSHLNSLERLPGQFDPLWRSRRRMILHPSVCERAFAYFKEQMPDKIDDLTNVLCAASGMSSEDLHSNHYFIQAFPFACMVQAYRPDYLHSYFFYEGTFYALVASYLLDIPRGVSCYADHVLKDHVLKLVPLHLRQCDLVIATSKRIKRELMGIAPEANPDRIIVKPNAIDVAQFPTVDWKEPENGEPYRLICVSRIDPKKGLLYLVEALRILRDRNLDVQLHLIGGIDGNVSSQEYARMLRNRIEELKIGRVVHLEGPKSQSDIKLFFTSSHLFVAPFIETDYGDKDGIPTSLLEAMASGLPVVATDAGSICEVIDDGHDGVLVPQRDSKALASTIADLIASPQRRRCLGENAATKIRAKFDVDVCEHIFHNRLLQVLEDKQEQVS